MLWIILILMCFLQTVESEDCKKCKIIVGRLGEKLKLYFSLSDLRDKYNKHITERYGKKIIENDIQIQDLKKKSYIRFKDKTDSKTSHILFKYGNQTHFVNSWTEIFTTNDTFVVKKLKLQKEDAGIYWIQFRSIRMGQQALIIAGIPKIKGRSPPDPVLKAEDNYTSTIQLECYSVSTSVGYCQKIYNTMRIAWYRNGMRMTDIEPTLSQINVKVDLNGGNFTCLATDYPPCYQRLQTAKHYDVLNVEECKNTSERKAFKLQPQYPPIEAELEPDQRKITVNKNEDLKVRCSAKCNPKCDVRWEKDFHGLKSSGLIHFRNNKFENDLKIEHINSSHEGIYVCLVNNIHGEVKNGFTLSVRETEDKAVEVVIVIAVIVVAIVIIVAVVVVVFIYKKFKREKYLPQRNGELEESLPDEGIYESVIDLHQDESLPGISTDNDSRNGEPGTPTDNDSRNGELGIPTDNDSRNGEQNTNLESHIYDALELNTSNGNRNPDPESGYTRLFKIRRQKQRPKAKLWYWSLLKKVMQNEEG